MGFDAGWEAFRAKVTYTLQILPNDWRLRIFIIPNKYAILAKLALTTPEKNTTFPLLGRNSPTFPIEFNKETYED